MFLDSNIIIIMKSLQLLNFIWCGSTESMDNSTIIRDFEKVKDYKLIAGCIDITIQVCIYFITHTVLVCV